MILRRLSPEAEMLPTYSRCSGESSVSARSCAMPSTPFMGVRISWLMLARNALLLRLAFSAASLACCSSAPRRSCAERWLANSPTMWFTPRASMPSSSCDFARAMRTARSPCSTALRHCTVSLSRGTVNRRSSNAQAAVISRMQSENPIAKSRATCCVPAANLWM